MFEFKALDADAKKTPLTYEKAIICFAVLAAKDPDAGLPNVVEELPGGLLSTASNTGMGAAPYLTISTYSKWKRALALTLTNSSVSLRWIL